MSDAEYIKKWNAVTYLRDFINTSLILTDEELYILDTIQNQNIKVFESKPLYRICQRCNEIKPVEEFENRKTICKECRKKESICKQ